MGLTKLIREFISFNEQRNEFKKILDNALTRDSYEKFGEKYEVNVPKDIRLAYFNLFKDLSKEGTVIHDVLGKNVFIREQPFITFFSKGYPNSPNIELTYSPESVKLEISSCYFGKRKDLPEIVEIGLFLTEKNKSGEFATNLRTGKDSKFDSSYNSILKAIYKIQRQDVIPKISEDILHFFDNHSNSNNLNKLDLS